jgi:bacterioferritin-associated ferredoxin
MQQANNHLSDGEIRAHLDQSLSMADLTRVAGHLASCSSCSARAVELRERSQRTQAHLFQLDQESNNISRTTLPAARARLVKHLEIEKEKQTMNSTVFSRIPRLAWAAVVLVAVLAVALTFEPVRALANDFLGLFRVEQIRIVEIDPEKISEQMENSSQLEYILSKEVDVQEKGEPQEVASAEEASALAGFPLRQLGGAVGEPAYLVQPGASLNFTVDMELVRGVLRDLGREDIQLPENLDGAQVQVEIPAGVAVSYGSCNFKEQEVQFDPDDPQASMPDLKDCITLFQSPSPIVTSSPDLDLTQIGEAYLQVLGMDAQEAAEFARGIDWSTTFVVPLPTQYASYETVDVDGTQGTLVFSRSHGTGQYTLLWVKNGVVYALSGEGTKLEALKAAETIQ